MPKVTYTGDRPWAVGKAEGLGREYVLEPGQTLEVDEGDVARLSRLGGVRDKLRLMREVAQEANRGETRGAAPASPAPAAPPQPDGQQRRPDRGRG